MKTLRFVIYTATAYNNARRYSVTKKTAPERLATSECIALRIF